MTEGEKPCGLASFLSMSCRGRAEAFARRLHNRLRSLGSHDGDTSENSWLTNTEVPNSVTSLQPRHSVTENVIFTEFDLFETPGSPEEEIIVDSELTKFITNPKDDLHHLNLDECSCLSGDTSCHIVKRSSLDSVSSEDPYLDPENVDCCNHVNGVSTSESRTDDEEIIISPKDEYLPSDLPTASECSISSLSRNLSEDNTLEDSLSENALEERIDKQVTSGWCVNYDEPQKNSSRNNNIYSAIDLESLKQSTRSSQEEISSSSNDSNESKCESYYSHLNIQQDLTIECPNSINNLISPIVEICTLEINDTDENKKEDDETNLEVNGAEGVIRDLNLLQVQSPENEFNDDIEIEERIPRVRRCSSLKSGKTPPSTPGRKKIVRFADVLGLDLADVRTFMDDIPKIPISAYDDLSIDLTSSLSDTSLCSNSLSLDSIPSNKTVVPMFQQPGGEGSFMEKIRNNQVCLEHAILKDPVTLCISGTVRVRNLDFHKSVHIRYTINGWKSCADLQATYVDGSCDGFSDKFTFTLYVHTLSIGQSLEFAVRFQSKGCQYWDNNGGENYVFQCLPTCSNSTYVPLLTDDNNWATFY